jgi:hypothetical protein
MGAGTVASVADTGATALVCLRGEMLRPCMVMQCQSSPTPQGSFTLQADPSRAEPDRTELNRAERVTIRTASRADPN